MVAIPLNVAHGEPMQANEFATYPYPGGKIICAEPVEPVGTDETMVWLALKTTGLLQLLNEPEVGAKLLTTK